MRLVFQEVKGIIGKLSADQIGQSPDFAGADSCVAMFG
jgi:hypothetical protein